ncbi:hypothetical protein HL42_1837 [Trichophyton rubrum]|nr:hypothetical protein HL42_1837 [Trichophyton rubrum]
MSPNRQQRMTARIPRSWQLGMLALKRVPPAHQHLSEHLSRGETDNNGVHKPWKPGYSAPLSSLTADFEAIPDRTFTILHESSRTEKWLIRGSEASLTTAKPTDTAAPTKATDNRPSDPCLSMAHKPLT